MAGAAGARRGAPAPGRQPARRAARRLSTAGHGRALRLRPQLHVVRAAELLLGEIDLELARELASVPGKPRMNCSLSAPPLSQLASSDEVMYRRLPSQLCEIMLICLPVTFS